ncbi:MAG: dehydrogenase [Burkholderiales bacterium]|nr:dehydrogenase [Burkholderiales bacterium]
MASILLTQAIHPAVQARLAALGEVRVAADTSPDTLRRDASGCAVVVVRAPLPEDIFDAAPALVGAVRHGAGVDMIPIEAATARGVLVANVPGANAHTVAEHVLLSLLHLARRRGATQARLGAGTAGWAAARALADFGFELPGRTVGLVGYGHVGQAVARICASGLAMRVLAHSRSGPRPGAPPVEHVALRDLLARSDFVVLACPLTEHTRGLIGAAELAAMRTGAFLVNVSRGPVVQEAALLDALRSGHLAGAALDVFDLQPLRVDHPYRQMEQVLLTPHVAGVTEDSMLRMGLGVVLAVEHLLRGDVPPHCINPQAVAAFRLRLGAKAGTKPQSSAHRDAGSRRCA